MEAMDFSADSRVGWTWLVSSPKRPHSDTVQMNFSLLSLRRSIVSNRAIVHSPFQGGAFPWQGGFLLHLSLPCTEAKHFPQWD